MLTVYSPYRCNNTAALVLVVHKELIKLVLKLVGNVHCIGRRDNIYRGTGKINRSIAVVGSLSAVGVPLGHGILYVREFRRRHRRIVFLLSERRVRSFATLGVYSSFTIFGRAAAATRDKAQGS